MNWRHLQPVAATAIGLAIPAPLLWDRDFTTIMAFELLMKPLGALAMVGLIVLLFFESREARRMTLLALVCLPAAAFASIHVVVDLSLGDRVRWLAERSELKQGIGASASSRGDLKHVEWHEDGWGGLNFFDYVVYDPSDRLGETWSSSKDGRVPGLPCPAGYGLRFERGYYMVTFHLPWGDCET